MAKTGWGEPVIVRHLVDVHVLLLRGEEVLLTQRKGGPWDGMWHLPSGKLDPGEPLTAAAAREAEEEVGVLIDPADLSCTHTIHVNASGPEARLGIFFATRRWTGEPSNREPDKCISLRWFPLDDLPANIIPTPSKAFWAHGTASPTANLVGEPAECSKPSRSAKGCLVTDFAVPPGRCRSVSR